MLATHPWAEMRKDESLTGFVAKGVQKCLDMIEPGRQEKGPELVGAEAIALNVRGPDDLGALEQATRCLGETYSGPL